MEVILYYIIECRDLLISFLILMFIVGVVCFLGIRNFSQQKRMKVAIYGLFAEMNNIDIIKISTILIKTFLIFYATIVLDQTQILISLIMIIILTLIYIILSPKRLIYEVVSTLFNVTMIYFIYTLNNYSVTINNSNALLIIRMLLIIFILIFTGYLFFREIYIIPKDRQDKIMKREKKKQQTD